MSFNVFVSYSSKDATRISLFLESLKSIRDLSCYFFKETKGIAKDTRDDILANIRASDCLLLFHSHNTLGSDYVQNEIGAAMGLDKQVIVCRLDLTEPKAMLQGVNYLDLYDPRTCARELDRLVAWIQDNIRQQQARSFVEHAPEENFDWVSFLLLVGMLVGALWLISRTVKSKQIQDNARPDHIVNG
jgi:hypothetical protein